LWPEPPPLLPHPHLYFRRHVPLNCHYHQIGFALKQAVPVSYLRHGMCFRMSCLFVSSILFWFPQRTHCFWRVLRFLFMERKQDYNVTSVKNVKICF
jgi:hypothetical protein